MSAAEPTRPAPWWLAGATIVVGIALAVPLAGVVFQAVQAGWSTTHRTLSGPLLPTLLVHTLLLTTIVSTACGCIGLGAAWLVERTDVPFRRVFAIVLLLPLAIPEFVAGYAWVSIAPSVHGLWGASL